MFLSHLHDKDHVRLAVVRPPKQAPKVLLPPEAAAPPANDPKPRPGCFCRDIFRRRLANCGDSVIKRQAAEGEKKVRKQCFCSAAFGAELLFRDVLQVCVLGSEAFVRS